MASTSAKEELSSLFNEDGTVNFEGCETAPDRITRILDARAEKYNEVSRKYAAPLRELSERLEAGEPAVKKAYLEVEDMTEVEFDNADAADDISMVSDDWEPEGTWDEFAESLIGNSVEEEEEDILLQLEATGILDSYELADGVYRKKSQG